MREGDYRLVMWENEAGDCPMESFLKDLGEPKRAALEAALVRILAIHGADVCKTEYGKPLGDGLYEFRLRHELHEVLKAAGRPDLVEKWTTEPTSVLLRVFFHMEGDKVVLLFGGYDKGKNPSDRRQNREIKQAKKRLREYQGRKTVGRRFLDLWRERRKKGLVRFATLDELWGMTHTLGAEEGDRA